MISGLSSALVAKLLTSAQAPSSPSISSGRGIAPLYIEHLLRFTREHGGGAPPRLADLIALRIERLAADERKLLQAIAVVGDNSDRDSLEFLLPEDFASKFDETLALLRLHGMVEDAETGGMRTSHPLLRDIVLATIPAEVRRDLHRLAAEAAEERRAPVEVCALHELHAQNAFDALLLLERVAQQCAARGDVSGNILALRRGLELARRELFRGELDDPMRAVLIFSRKLGESLAVAGSFVDAKAFFAKLSIWPDPAVKIAHAFWARSRTSHTVARVAKKRRPICAKPSSSRAAPTHPISSAHSKICSARSLPEVSA